MKLLLFVFLVALPFCSYSQKIKIKVGATEFDTDSIPAQAKLSNPVRKFSVKKDKPDKTVSTYVVQIGEEEQSFRNDGNYQEVTFSHDVRGLMVYILDEKRSVYRKPFILKKPK